MINQGNNLKIFNDFKVDRTLPKYLKINEDNEI